MNDRQKTIVLSEHMAEKFLNVDERIDRVDRDVHILYYVFMAMIVVVTTFMCLTMCGCADVGGYYCGGDYVPVHSTYDEIPSTYSSGSALTTRSGNSEYTTFSNGGSAFTTHSGASSYTTYSGF